MWVFPGSAPTAGGRASVPVSLRRRPGLRHGASVPEVGGHRPCGGRRTPSTCPTPPSCTAGCSGAPGGNRWRSRSSCARAPTGSRPSTSASPARRAWPAGCWRRAGEWCSTGTGSSCRRSPRSSTGWRTTTCWSRRRSRRSRPTETRLHSAVTFSLRVPHALIKALLPPLAGLIFAQDARILRRQAETIDRFGGEQFASTEIDVLGQGILRLLRRAERGDPGTDPSDDHPAERRLRMRGLSRTVRSRGGRWRRGPGGSGARASRGRASGRRGRGARGRSACRGGSRSSRPSRCRGRRRPRRRRRWCARGGGRSPRHRPSRTGRPRKPRWYMIPITPPRSAMARIWSSSRFRQDGWTPETPVWVTTGGRRRSRRRGPRGRRRRCGREAWARSTRIRPLVERLHHRPAFRRQPAPAPARPERRGRRARGGSRSGASSVTRRSDPSGRRLTSAGESKAFPPWTARWTARPSESEVEPEVEVMRSSRLRLARAGCVCGCRAGGRGSWRSTGRPSTGRRPGGGGGRPGRDSGPAGGRGRGGVEVVAEERGSRRRSRHGGRRPRRTRYRSRSGVRDRSG